ncbi:hypothetical protein EpCFBP13511_22940 [Erwinia persicina]|uniref:Uncharacterized protein n=1 Tax=Erwinia persicina TaxID=55211 RepID=A0A4U3ESF2_9GAMM|nr:hypothetical protein EpCFBP13511_22940 [Erwinia persicina]
MFCSEVTFGINDIPSVLFEVNGLYGRAAGNGSKLTDYLLYFAAGGGRLMSKEEAVNAAGGGFQACAGLPGAGMTVQRQHRHRDGRGYLRRWCIRG